MNPVVSLMAASLRVSLAVQHPQAKGNLQPLSPDLTQGFHLAELKYNPLICKEIEENNRLVKTRDLIKKMRDTEETFHAKMGTMKDRSSMDLIEAEDIKKR